LARLVTGNRWASGLRVVASISECSTDRSMAVLALLSLYNGSDMVYVDCKSYTARDCALFLSGTSYDAIGRIKLKSGNPPSVPFICMHATIELTDWTD